MLSSHMMSTGQRSFLEQKVNLLEEELHQYRQKQSKLNKLNESILQTYKQNQHYRQSRQDKLQKENRQLTLKHRQEIRKLKNLHNKQKTQLQNQVNSLKEKLHKAQTSLQQNKLQHQKQLIEVKKSLQNTHIKHIDQIEKDLTLQLQQVTLKLQQLNQINLMYKEYIQRKQYQFHNPNKTQSTFKTKSKQRPLQIQQKQNKQNPFSRQKQQFSHQNQYSGCYPLSIKDQFNFNKQIYEMKENNIAAKRVAKQSKKLISELSTRINRAMRQIHDDKKLQRF